MGRGYPILAHVPVLLTEPFRFIRDRFWRASWAGSYEVRYAAACLSGCAGSWPH